MKRKDMWLLLLSKPSPDMLASLEKAGFGRIVDDSGRQPRDALKAALSDGAKGILTLDPASGFSVADVEKVADELAANPDKLCVGEPEEPAKKGAASAIYAMLAGVGSATAITSLFGMSARTAEGLVGMKSGEDTFLMNLPLEARISNVDLAEVETGVQVPAPGFHLLTRSFKLYYVFLKFSIAAMIAYLVDIGTFWLFEVWFGFLPDEFKVLVATVLSRILCSIATYILNKGAVFRSDAKQSGAVVRFLILSVAQLVASWLLVWSLGALLGGSDVTNMLLKVVVDFVIFMVSFPIQRDWVFKKSEGLLK